ncbi:MAG: hypothetical protein QHH30_06455 [candidate division NC10 bacterium]|nr:hypothetical protein [candidate division NC10 bacterium]
MRNMMVFSLLLTVTLSLAFWLDPLPALAGGQNDSPSENLLSIDGYEGKLENIEIPATVQAIRELQIGDPAFLQELGSLDSYGISNCQGGVLQKGSAVVHVFKVRFRSEEQAVSVLNLKRKPSSKRGPLMVEDATNCRNPDFGLYFDGNDWSGFRRVKEVVVLLKGPVSQEDFFKIMEKII